MNDKHGRSPCHLHSLWERDFPCTGVAKLNAITPLLPTKVELLTLVVRLNAPDNSQTVIEVSSTCQQYRSDGFIRRIDYSLSLSTTYDHSSGRLMSFCFSYSQEHNRSSSTPPHPLLFYLTRDTVSSCASSLALSPREEKETG